MEKSCAKSGRENVEGNETPIEVSNQFFSKYYIVEFSGHTT